ncbi:MAG: dTDP-4-dehydrorhamnose reductase [Gammaproteobacteria bacterium]|nr:dTDP-4-dehydrorhamnose reductase [Gammaproteobacteria bacterium]
MKVLIAGAQGQLGQELQRLCPSRIDCLPVGRAELDITSRAGVLECVRELQPQVIINTAAYTAVDGAEAKPDLAVEVNAEGTANLAMAAQCIGARVLHVSTDFVFDGAADTPYPSDHETRPLGVYGHSKLAGENRLQQILPLDSVVVRTAWLYSALGENFVKTMLRLMSEREQLRVVADQVGAPTWARGLAAVLWQLLDYPAAHGIYHWTDNGSCSWYEFACAIYAEGHKLGLLEREVQIDAITTEDHPTPAQRPCYSVLDCKKIHNLLGIGGENWRPQLAAMLGELARP